MGLRHLPVVNAVGEVSELGRGELCPWLLAPSGLSSHPDSSPVHVCHTRPAGGTPWSAVHPPLPVLVSAPELISSQPVFLGSSCLLGACVALIECKVKFSEGFKR